MQFVPCNNNDGRTFRIVEIEGISYVQSSGKLKFGDSLAFKGDIGYGTIGGAVEKMGNVIG